MVRDDTLRSQGNHTHFTCCWQLPGRVRCTLVGGLHLNNQIEAPTSIHLSSAFLVVTV